MRSLALALLCAFVSAAAGGAAAAQNLNIDLGLGFGTATVPFGGAAGQAGVWNEIDMEKAGIPFALTDTSGGATGASLVYFESGNGNKAFDDPATTGGDGLLLDDCVEVGSALGDQVRFQISGLAAGTYDLYVYAWSPEDPALGLTRVEVGSPGSGAQTCGGAAWSGAHVLGATYVVATVDAPNGLIEFRVGVESAGLPASCNGIQLVRKPPCGPFLKYCTAGTTQDGCQASISAQGVPSASASSGFDLVVTGAVGNKDLIFFWSLNGKQALPWGNSSSYRCVVPPAVRGGLLLPHTGTKGGCDQWQFQDLNALWCSTCPQPAKNPGAGAMVWAQSWFRDPFSTSNQTTAMSDAIEFAVCP